MKLHIIKVSKQKIKSAEKTIKYLILSAFLSLTKKMPNKEIISPKAKTIK